ncbi:hypothetical protein OIU80_01210 [Flavobacterium sp. LS1R47]|uniref:RHS repeat-associated protein n=1 Tax=Flavobacterium frigoritolerans TaxID=2987686 RepID=A0A9X2YYE7_9FLAO|nr:RHS repeat-associated core domain-containing protein [Flavobacterium frigoritolerans]MCV9930889.1 hypothetical protein [Flavobacterium frigoritolerans]
MKQFYLLLLFFVTHLTFSQNFTDTKGELQISNSGTATYTLPIAIPPSIKSVAPIINLTYSSGVRGGIAGQGWSINSISAISRMATRRDIDGFTDGVDFDDNDKLALDGQRLLLKTGTYWVTGSTYETEYKSNTKIELNKEGTTTYFVVTAPDGSRSWYGSQGSGNLQNSISVNSWYIVRYEDSNGNYISYNYKTVTYNNTNQLYINTIAFSGNTIAGITAENKIVFNYRGSKRIEKDYANGAPVYATQILDNIQVSANNTLFRRYKLTQEADPILGYERITQIQEYNGQDEASNPVIFKYDNTETKTTRIEKEYTNNLAFDRVDVAGDFDGDGRLDFAMGDKVYTKLFQENSGNAPIVMPFLTSTNKTFAATTLTSGKLNQFSSMINPVEELNSITFNYYNLSNNTVNLVNSKSVPISNLVYKEECITGGGGAPEHGGGITVTDLTNLNNQYIEGDFNGDGISEVIIFQYLQTDHYEMDGPCFGPNGEPLMCTCVFKNTSIGYCPNFTYYLNLAPNASTELNSKDFMTMTELVFCKQYENKFVADFNGDGKTDILFIDNTTKDYRIVSIKQLTAAPWHEVEIIGTGNLDKYSKTKQILIGDYNGDGKTDIMIPDTEGGEGADHAKWHIYYSNSNAAGGDFFTKEAHNIVEYRPDTNDDYKTQRHYSNYYAIDINKDGKSDLVRVWRNYYKPKLTINDHDTEWQVTGFTNNIGKVGASVFIQTYASEVFDSNSPDVPIPIASNFKYNAANTDLVLVRGHYNRIEYYQFNKNVNTDNRLKSVTEVSGNITQTIEYQPMEAVDFRFGNATTDFYSSSDTALYPDIEIIQNPESFLVSKLTATINGISKYQDFRYRGYVSNYNYGTVGFTRTTRSSWYLSPTDAKIWTTQYNDPSLRGANTITWSSTNASTVFAAIPTDLLSTKTNVFATYSKGGNTPSIPMPSDINIVNPVIASATTKASNSITASSVINNDLNVNYQAPQIILKPGFSAKASGNSMFRAYPFIESENAPTTNSSVYNVLLTKQTTEDHLTGIKNETSFTYDGTVESTNYYGLETQSISRQYSGGTLQGTNTTNTQYDNNPTGVGNGYYIGRPKKVNSSSTIYTGDTRTSEEKYTYTGTNLTQTEKKGHNTYAIIEDMIYDTVGNLLTKKVSAPAASVPVAARTITDEYDSTKRFVIKKTDHQGFVTDYAYNTLGQVTKSTNYMGVVSDFTYDNWGKLTTNTSTNVSQTPLVINIVYEKRSDGGYMTTNTTNTDSKTITVFDVLGRAVITTTKGFAANSMVSKQVVYDALGRKTKESEPSLSSPDKWTLYEYDYLMRPTKITLPTDKIQTIAYNGLTTTSTDDGRTTTATVDALGNKIQTTDPGGTISFVYYANGSLKESNYEGNKVTVSIDGWGNKVAMTDPSAGTYTYSYDAFGQIKTETTPNGTTSFAYDDAGKTTEKTIKGTNTDSKTTYAYNSLNQITSSTFTNIFESSVITNNYEYDTYKRISRTIETTPYATFTKELTYDTYGRADKETSIAAASGKTSAKTVKNTYQNGFPWQIVDDTTQQILWQTNALNERGQLIGASLGNGIVINNTYDQYGYAEKFKHDKTGTAPVNIMTLTTTFEPKRGNLTNRTNSLFNWNENFKYDELDRLTSYYNAQGVPETQSYDAKGKISKNSVGTYNYTVPNKTYQNNSITLSPESLTYYQNRGSGANTAPRLGIEVTYNTFKSPVRIREQGRDGTYNDYINFAYNDGNDRSTMFYGGLQDDKLQRRYRKHYSGDGSMEIKEDETTGTVEFVTYIGGDGYTASVVLKSDGINPANYLYLHRDYQGSIIAITDNNATIVEKRLYDAWGAIIKVQNGAGVTLDGLTVLDRGYTGHEHVQSMGLINMNGRLYDPKLHRFLQPDNFIQEVENTQNYNRYAYVLNNPLKYTDPSGELAFLAVVGIGAAVAAFSYTLTALLADVPFSVGGLAKSTFIGAASAAVTFGIGNAASSLFSTPAMGFWQGAYQGAIIGGISGIGSTIATAAFTGNSITLKAVLGGAVTGAIVGGVMGGIQGGINAENSGREFWSGQKWEEIKMGYQEKSLFSNKVNFSDTKWDIDQQMKIPQTNQNFEFDCTHACKLSVDSYFGVSGQEANNLSWLKRANTLDSNGIGGIKNMRIMGMYNGTGYSTNPLGNGYYHNYDAKESLPWMSNQMAQNRIIQIGWMPDGTLGHASLVTRLRYLSDFSKFRIDIMNPNSGGTSVLKSLKNIHQIFSIWKQ